MEIVTATPFPPAPPLRAAIRASCRIDESEAVARILAAAALPARDARPDRRPGAGARRRGAPRTPRQRRDRRVSARICAVLARRGRPPVPRRGLAAGARRGDGRPADPRQDRRGELGKPSRPVRIDLRQRLDLGVDADRPAAARRTGGALLARRAAPSRRPLGRAGGAPGGDRRDAHPRPPVRHRAHDRGGDRARPRGRAPRLPAFLRHARRGGAHRGRCRALLRGL